MNILFTCVGRRNYLLQYFKEALNESGSIFAADLQPSAPALTTADKAFIVPEVYSEKYIDSLIAICKKEGVHRLVSLNDLELPVLAKERKRFEELGVRLLVSDPEVIDVCFDKFRTSLFAGYNGILSPKTFLSLDEAMTALSKDEISYPLVVKPRWGSASIGIDFPVDSEQLRLSFLLSQKKLQSSILFQASMNDLNQAIIIQEKIAGTEYGLDVLNDFNGQPVQVYVKEKLAMRAGETDKAVLRNIPELEDLGFKIGKALGHIGNLDVDVFEGKGQYYLLEMNPRFGGGYPFSHMAGANYPAAIVAWIQGKSFDFSTFRKSYDQAFAKCDTLVKVG
jgi:carbamoyl-phosphate synthase large subunit